jgi:hypothetical protein
MLRCISTTISAACSGSGLPASIQPMMASTISTGISRAAHRRRAVGKDPAEAGLGGGGDRLLALVHELPELGLPRRMAKQQPEAVRVVTCNGEERLDALGAEPAGADLQEPVLHRPQRRLQRGPVEVGLGVEVAVDGVARDPGLGGDVVQARRRESAAGEGAGAGGTALRPRWTASRPRSGSATTGSAACSGWPQALLFPHLSAVENVAFGLRALGMRRAAARRCAQAWLERMGLPDVADAPRTLSGGQQQRVALAKGAGDRPAAGSTWAAAATWRWSAPPPGTYSR